MPIGVAICSPDTIGRGDAIKPVVIQDWPNFRQRALVNKVPTMLAYRAGHFRIDSWGLSCPPLDELRPGMAIIQRFKLFLNDDDLENSFESDIGTVDDVRMWYRHFLTALHEHIVTHLQRPPWRVDWSSTKVEYIFSLPTVWKDNNQLVEDFKKIVKQAGFGSREKCGRHKNCGRHENCSVTIGLTEGEASAVYTAATSSEHKYKVSQQYAQYGG